MSGDSLVDLSDLDDLIQRERLTIALTKIKLSTEGWLVTDQWSVISSQ